MKRCDLTISLLFGLLFVAFMLNTAVNAFARAEIPPDMEIAEGMQQEDTYAPDEGVSPNIEEMVPEIVIELGEAVSSGAEEMASEEIVEPAQPMAVNDSQEGEDAPTEPKPVQTQDDPTKQVDGKESAASPNPESILPRKTSAPPVSYSKRIKIARAYLTDYLTSELSGSGLLQRLAIKWDEQHREYLNSEKQYRDELSKYRKGQKAYEAGLAQYREGKEKYAEGLQQYKEGAETLKKGSAALKEAKQKRRESQETLQKGEDQYKENLDKYESGAQQHSDAKEQVEKLPEGRWIIMNCRGNSSFVQLLLGSSNLASLEMTFSMLFVLVGALVIYATISKMIDEQRNLVGAGKALGLFNREIFAKYLLFGMTGTIVGTVLGILTARFLMEVYVLKSAGSYYTFDTTKPMLVVAPTAIALAAGGLLSLFATWFACTKLMRSTAIQLMQPKVPPGRKKAGGGKHVLPLYSRLILLNIRSDLRRVIVTIVSVAGCCALVVIGFTLKSAVEGALQKQYAKVVNYDGRIQYDPDAAENASAEIRKLLDSEGVEYTELYDGVVTFRIRDILVGKLLCGDISEISSYYHLLDWKTDEPLSPTDDGILIQKRTAESYNLKVGSEMELTLSNSRRATVRVAGIFDNYIGRVMVMSRACYRKTFGENCVSNNLYIRLNGADEAVLQENLMRIDGYDSYGRSDSDKALFASSSTLVIAIVALFIFMAAVMAGVVLTNLTNSYILQKKRELTIMRINGFTVREVISYVTRETVFTTTVGTIVGIAMGAAIAYRITRSLETAFVQYNRSVSLPAWAFGAVITAFFTILINVIVLRQVRRLKLTDIS